MSEEEICSTMRVRKSTRDMLNKMGAKGETYDDIIRRLLQEVEKLRDVKKKRGTS